MDGPPADVTRAYQGAVELADEAELSAKFGAGERVSERPDAGRLQTVTLEQERNPLAATARAFFPPCTRSSAMRSAISPGAPISAVDCVRTASYEPTSVGSRRGIAAAGAVYSFRRLRSANPRRGALPVRCNTRWTRRARSTPRTASWRSPTMKASSAAFPSSITPRWSQPSRLEKPHHDCRLRPPNLGMVGEGHIHVRVSQSPARMGRRATVCHLVPRWLRSTARHQRGAVDIDKLGHGQRWHRQKYCVQVRNTAGCRRLDRPRAAAGVIQRVRAGYRGRIAECVTLLLFASPIFCPRTAYLAAARVVLQFNDFYVITACYRAPILDGVLPPLWMALYKAFVSAAIFMAGLLWFRRLKSFFDARL